MYPVTTRDGDTHKYSVHDILTTMGNGQPPQNSASYAPKYSLALNTPVSGTSLTPTTLNNIEQTFIELQQNNEDSRHSGHYQGGFVPPPLSHTQDSSDSWSRGSPSPSQSSYGSSPAKKLKTNSRTAVLTEADIYTPGYLSTSRKPPQRTKDDKLSGDELHRRLVRRERNKQAAAKCRQRRVDHTNILIAETDKLDGERGELENEIQSLQQQKEHLEFLLQAHRPLCKLHHDDQVKVKVEPVEMPTVTGYHANHDDHALLDENSVPYSVSCYKPRPTTLPIRTPATTAQLGIPMSTPSSGIFTFGLDSIADGHTGLTPLTGVPSSMNSDVKDLASPTYLTAL